MKIEIEDKYRKIFEVLKHSNIVRVTYDSVYLNLNLSDLQLLYLPCIAYFNQIKFLKKYKLFYLNIYVGKITFIADNTVVTGVRCRVVLNANTMYFDDIRKAIKECPLDKQRDWGIHNTINEEE